MICAVVNFEVNCNVAMMMWCLVTSDAAKGNLVICGRQHDDTKAHVAQTSTSLAYAAMLKQSVV